MIVHTDCAFDPKSKAAGLALVIIDQGQRTILKYYLNNIYDNHQGEFRAVLLALKYLEEGNYPLDTLIQLKTDSKIVVQSIDKRYVKQEEYQYWLESILNYYDRYQLIFTQWVSEKENRGADQLAKQALHQQGNYTVLKD